MIGRRLPWGVRSRAYSVTHLMQYQATSILASDGSSYKERKDERKKERKKGRERGGGKDMG